GRHVQRVRVLVESDGRDVPRVGDGARCRQRVDLLVGDELPRRATIGGPVNAVGRACVDDLLDGCTGLGAAGGRVDGDEAADEAGQYGVHGRRTRHAGWRPGAAVVS